MEKTIKYSQFKFIRGNREIKEHHVLAVKAWIESRNLLEYRPILVNEKMEVIDGQHRLKAAERLGVPIFYTIQKGATGQDVIAYNTGNLKWTREDSLNYFLKEGNENYIAFFNFMNKHKLIINTTMDIFSNFDSFSGEDFLTGKIVWPHPDIVKKVEERHFKVAQIIDYLNANVPGGKLEKKYLYGISVARTLRSFFANEAVDYDTFLTKLKYNLDKVHPCARQRAYSLMWLNIYNWKNKNPLRDSFGNVPFVATMD
jgi:hypothetical protein